MKQQKHWFGQYLPEHLFRICLCASQEACWRTTEIVPSSFPAIVPGNSAGVSRTIRPTAHSELRHHWRRWVRFSQISCKPTHNPTAKENG
jgi:hypothetical protein